MTTDPSLYEATLLEQRDAANGLVTELAARAQKFDRQLSANETRDLDDALRTEATLTGRIEENRAQIALAVANEKRRAIVDIAKTGRFNESRSGYEYQTQTNDGGVYVQNGRESYFKDLLEARSGNSGACERLDRHSRQFNDTLRQKNITELRAINTSAGSGGEFAPPLWLIDDYVAALRPARATADILTKLELPGGTDIINIPKVNTGTATALQVTQNTGIQQTDLTSTTVPASVYTIAGGQVLSLQLFDQSPMAGTIDRVILGDLIADYARQVGNLVLNGTGTAQPYGLLNLPGTTAVTYTDAAPAFMGVGKLYSKIGQAVQAVQTARFLSPTHIVMHPRRWAWAAVQVDGANRAVILPAAGGPLNASGISSTGAAQGVVGEMFGLPVVIDPNVPTNLGAGTNQDPILIVKADDSWLYESSIRAEVFPQTYASQNSLYARVYNYMALAHRLPQSVAVINGTGLITPTF
ncbi:phage major capsid protein [Cryobacterium sp. 10I5]|uniref:phage major capsid protein n=2 Tax=Bacteria TaxID=2 RepID=UPI002B23D510|nr:phage major capsid protein [Cryobacterium sp. 10I5]MEB0264366.1 phage major capsid protein [Cryobacterium sp. 10I5]